MHEMNFYKLSTFIGLILLFMTSSLQAQRQLHWDMQNDFIRYGAEVASNMEFCSGSDDQLIEYFRDTTAFVSSAFDALVRKYEEYNFLREELPSNVFDEHIPIYDYKNEVASEKIKTLDSGKVSESTLCDQVFWLNVKRFEESYHELKYEINLRSPQEQKSFGLLERWYSKKDIKKKFPQTQEVMDWHYIFKSREERLEGFFEVNPYNLENEVKQKFHLVKKGDTLNQIAKLYEVSVNYLVSLNNDITKESIDKIVLGQKIYISDGFITNAETVEVKEISNEMQSIRDILEATALESNSKFFRIKEHSISGYEKLEIVEKIDLQGNPTEWRKYSIKDLYLKDDNLYEKKLFGGKKIGKVSNGKLIVD